MGAEEAADAGLMYALSSPDHTTQHIDAGIAAALNQRHSRSGQLRITAADLGSVRQRAALRCPALEFIALPDRLEQLRQATSEHKLLCAAAPVVQTCQKCGAGLQRELQNRDAWFFGDTQPPQQGALYSSTCVNADCGCLHFLDGWEDPSQRAAGARRAPRRLYTDAQHDHPRWVYVSPESLVGTDLVDRHDAQLLFSATSFEAAVKIYNRARGSESRFAPGFVDAHPEVATNPRAYNRTQRYRLSTDTFQAGYLLAHARGIARTTGAACLDSLDLNWPLDAILDWVCPALFQLCADRYHDHKRSMLALPRKQRPLSTCSEGDVTDGNCSLIRDICCETLGTPSREEQLDFAYNGQLRCPNTPGRNTGGRCPDCHAKWLLARQQQQQPGQAPARLADDSSQDAGRGGAEINPVPAGARPALVRTRAAARFAGATPELLLECQEEAGRDKFLVKWTDGTTSWQWRREIEERCADGVRLVRQYLEQQLKPSFYDKADDFEGERLPELPEEELSPDDSVGGTDSGTDGGSSPRSRGVAGSAGSPPRRAAARAKVPVQSCRGRTGQGCTGRSTGTVWEFCFCGFPAPPMELLGSESCTQTHRYHMKVYRGYGFQRSDGGRLMKAYDIGCHYRAFCLNEKRLAEASALAHDLATNVDFVVDCFHFTKNHVGAYCHKHCDPYKHPVLKNAAPGDRNMSVAEQRFKWVNRYRYFFRYFNRSRFNFMLLLLCYLDQEERM